MIKERIIEEDAARKGSYTWSYREDGSKSGSGEEANGLLKEEAPTQRPHCRKHIYTTITYKTHLNSG